MKQITIELLKTSLCWLNRAFGIFTTSPKLGPGSKARSRPALLRKSSGGSTRDRQTFSLRLIERLEKRWKENKTKGVFRKIEESSQD